MSGLNYGHIAGILKHIFSIALLVAIAGCGKEAGRVEEGKAASYLALDRANPQKYCASPNFNSQRTYCGTGVELESAKVARRDSPEACIKDVSFGVEGTKVWVKYRCKALFNLVLKAPKMTPAPTPPAPASAPPPWQNPVNRLDVNADGVVEQKDFALLVAILKPLRHSEVVIYKDLWPGDYILVNYPEFLDRDYQYTRTGTPDATNPQLLHYGPFVCTRDNAKRTCTFHGPYIDINGDSLLSREDLVILANGLEQQRTGVQSPCSAEAISVGGYCWYAVDLRTKHFKRYVWAETFYTGPSQLNYLGADWDFSTSCNDVCATHGGLNANGTNTYGASASCSKVADAFQSRNLLLFNDAKAINFLQPPLKHGAGSSPCGVVDYYSYSAIFLERGSTNPTYKNASAERKYFCACNQ